MPLYMVVSYGDDSGIEPEFGSQDRMKALAYLNSKKLPNYQAIMKFPDEFIGQVKFDVPLKPVKFRLTKYHPHPENWIMEGTMDQINLFIDTLRKQYKQHKTYGNDDQRLHWFSDLSMEKITNVSQTDEAYKITPAEMAYVEAD